MQLTDMSFPYCNLVLRDIRSHYQHCSLQNCPLLPSLIHPSHYSHPSNYVCYHLLLVSYADQQRNPGTIQQTPLEALLIYYFTLSESSQNFFSVQFPIMLLPNTLNNAVNVILTLIFFLCLIMPFCRNLNLLNERPSHLTLTAVIILFPLQLLVDI